VMILSLILATKHYLITAHDTCLEYKKTSTIGKKHGHKFRCFTQHDNRNDIINDYSEFNDVVKIPRGNAASSRNLVLDYYSKDEWIGIWDNDATVYFDKLDTKNFIRDLDAICQEAEQLAISSFVPFNAQQAPYPLNQKMEAKIRTKNYTIMVLR